MSQYLTNLTLAFSMPALLVGLLFALSGSLQPDTRKRRRSLAWSIGMGLLGGFLLAEVIAPQTSITRLTTGVRGVVIVVALLQILTLVTHARWRTIVAVRFLAWGFVLLLCALLGVQATYDFLQRAAEQSLSVTEVLNTELILNIGAITAGLLVIGFLSFISARMAIHSVRLRWLLYTTLIALLVLKWSGDAMLGLLQLDALELTRARLSFVGKVTNFAWAFSYFSLLLVAVLYIVCCRGQGRAKAGEVSLPSPERRKMLARIKTESRWLRGSLASILFLTCSMLYFDLYASRPPTLSEAVEVRPDVDGIVRIPLDGITDGDLYRYAYITEDGRRVRFFAINVLASRDRVRMSAVYDTCMICGDAGYIQDGNEVICVACNVRVFIPSIGKPGGCNPIPFPWEQDEAHLLVKAEVLDQGAKYFSEVVEIEVRDPVTGKTLINLKAPYQYDFRGKTFYFESEDSLERFKADPEKFAADTAKRHYRAEGWKS